MRFLIPLVLLLLGLGGGVGAGLLLAPSADASNQAAPPRAEGEAGNAGHGQPGEESGGSRAAAMEGEDELPGARAEGHDYVRLNNQFVVPLLTGNRVASLILLSIAVEVTAGQEEAVLMREPKLRDTFLQVLFDHANAGGFGGLFTAGSVMRELRHSLLEAAQEEVGGLVTDVLILDIARQDK